VGDFSEGIGGRGGDGDGGDDAGFDHAESEERCAEAADDGLKGLGEFGGLEIIGGHLMAKSGAVARMVAMAAAVARAAPRTVSIAAEADVFDGHAFVDGGRFAGRKASRE